MKHETGGYVLKEDDIKHLEGRILTQIEALGIPPNQEAAAKSIFSQIIWDLLEPTYIWIDAEEINKLNSVTGLTGQTRPKRQ